MRLPGSKNATNSLMFVQAASNPYAISNRFCCSVAEFTRKRQSSTPASIAYQHIFWNPSCHHGASWRAATSYIKEPKCLVLNNKEPMAAFTWQVAWKKLSCRIDLFVWHFRLLRLRSAVVPWKLDAMPVRSCLLSDFTLALDISSCFSKHRSSFFVAAVLAFCHNFTGDPCDWVRLKHCGRQIGISSLPGILDHGYDMC